MLNTKLKLTLGLAALTAATALAQTQTAAPAGATSAPAATPVTVTPAAPVAPPSAFDQWVKETKNRMVPLTWGADVRLRNEYVNNALTLSDGGARHEQDYFRFRERIWASAMPVTNVSVNARLAAEETRMDETGQCQPIRIPSRF